MISGGENISTIEVEQALDPTRPCSRSAVVGVPDEKWGERPKAYRRAAPRRQRHPGRPDRPREDQIAGYKAPRDIDITVQLPKTPTGKIQKFLLRDAEWAGRMQRVKG